MRLERVSLMGLTRFMGPVSIDFAELGDGLISLSGPNGAGKTTLLEAAAAALFRTLPSRPGSLYEYAHGRDAYIEAAFSHEGRALLAKVLVDAEARKTEGYLTDDGSPVSSGKARDYEAAVAARFGSQPLFLASVFAAQNRAGDFLTAPRAARKALFAELLGLGDLDALASAAAERALEVKDRYARLEGQERALAERVVGLESLAQDLARAHESLAGLMHELGERSEAAKAALTAAERARAAAAEATRRRRELEARVEKIERRITAIGREREEAERGAQAARTRYTRLRDRPDTTDADTRAATVAFEAAQRRAEERRERAQAALERRPQVEHAIAQLQVVEEGLADARAAAAAVEKAVALRDRERAAYEALTADVGDGRPACEGVDEKLYDACPLIGAARDRRERLEEVEKKLERAQSVVNGALMVVSQKPAVELLERSRDELRAVAEGKALVEAAEWDLAHATDEVDVAETVREKTLQRIETAKAEREREIAEALDEVRAAGSAAARVAAVLDDEEEDLLADRIAVRGELERLEDPPAIPDVEAAERALAQTRKAADEAHAEVARLEERKAAAEQDQARLDKVRDDIDAAQVELAEWRILAEGLGRNGVQALEIDAAGPTVAAHTNELLEACYGPRFSLSFETLREKRSAKGEYTEVFEVHVYDGPRVRQVEALSGGERVIVGEALSLALAVYNAQQSHVRWETLWRDETAGALDPANAQAYVDMLRKAMALGGFRQVIYVSHVPEVWARADVALRVEDGRVTR